MRSDFRTAFLDELHVQQRSLRSISTEAGISYEMLKKLKQGKSGSTSVEHGVAIAGALGLTLDELLSGDRSKNVDLQFLRIAGEILDRAQVVMEGERIEGGGAGKIPCPPQASPERHFGIRVVGDSLTPVYENGGVLIFRQGKLEQVQVDAIDRISICRESDGNCWIRQVKVGTAPGLFHLLSVNLCGSNLLDRPVIGAVPVWLYLPPDIAMPGR